MQLEPREGCAFTRAFTSTAQSFSKMEKPEYNGVLDVPRPWAYLILFFKIKRRNCPMEWL